MMVYVHVPFCRSKCRYCAFYSEPLDGVPPERVGNYLATVRDELSQKFDMLCREQRQTDSVTSIFFGGGTPSLLKTDELAELLVWLRASLPVAPDAEITLEGNPESLVESEKLTALVRAGFNRLSMGVQSMDDRDLAMLGRTHRSETVRLAMQCARKAGFGNVSMDLIWGLPGQDAGAWIRQLDAVMELQPEHLSAYGLTLEPGTPLSRDVEQGRLALPDEQTMADMYLAGIARLQAGRFQQYEVSNFARDGYVCRHNMGYWTGQDYLGLGPAAVSTLGNLRLSNPENLESWIGQVTRRADPDTEKLDQTVRIEERIMLRLRTCAGLDLDALRTAFGYDLLADQGHFVQDLIGAGLALLEGGILRLTRRGMLVSNEILSRFFER